MGPPSALSQLPGFTGCRTRPATASGQGWPSPQPMDDAAPPELPMSAVRAALPLVASLAILAAADPPPTVAAGGSAPSTTSPTFAEVVPGKPLLGAGRQVVVQGYLDVDTLTQDNYRDGENSVGDHRGRGLLRSALGMRLKLDDAVLVQLTVGYHAEAGGGAANNPVDGPATGAGTTGNAGTNKGTAIMQEAFARLQEVLGFETLGLVAGRMPVSFWLHDKHRAFLFDSRADDRDLSSWDGAQASYSGIEDLLLTGYTYRLPDASGLSGLVADWQPVQSSGDDRLFVTLSWNLQRDVPVKGLARRGKSLTTWYAGLDYRQGGVGLWAEFARQSGQEGDGLRYAGYGGSAGLEITPGKGSPFSMALIGDWMTGDGKPSDDKNENFINPYESINDTYIVESEKYGEISRYMDGNLRAAKVKVGVAFDNRDTVRMDLVYGAFQTDQPVAGSSRWLGQELDLTTTWQYSYNVTSRVFLGAFKPGSAFRAIAPGPDNGTIPGVRDPGDSDASTNPIYLIGGNILVEF
jgi:hypothetical protein